jgi:PAS domain S-box-containing protein
MPPDPTNDSSPSTETLVERLAAENAELRTRLEEAEDALRAIREGEVDAVIVSGSQGDRVFSLMETENLHRQMVETMNEAGLAISQDGLLLYANDRAAALLSRRRSNLLGRPLKDLVVPQDAERLRALLQASKHGTADDRVVFRAADGAAVPMHLWASRLDRPAGAMICLVGTDLSRLEADRALVAQLEEQQKALSASRAEALDLMAQALVAREQAAQAALELRESDRRKDAFLATLAHELRNPLAPIRNALEILRSRGIGACATDEAQEIIERQFAHLVRLVDDLLEVSRITHGKIDLRTERVELATVISSAVETVRPLIDAAAQTLEVDLPSQPLWLDGDPIRLSQVFANLLNNATKYTGTGQTICLDARRCETGVWVSVRDTGAGIPAELLPRIFDIFAQGAPNPSAVHGGLGVGLSLVRKLVELHGGRVEARSPGPGQGSELLVYLPLSPGEASSAEPSIPAAAGVTGLTTHFRILVVDDNRDAANSLAILLEYKGAEVEVAYDGPSALEALSRQPPDMAIMDIAMPGMDGLEVARRIRAHPRHRDMRLIAMTGLGEVMDRDRSAQAGFDRHLVKPVSIDTLDGLLMDLATQDPWPPSGAQDAAEPGPSDRQTPRDTKPRLPKRRLATQDRDTPVRADQMQESRGENPDRGARDSASLSQELERIRLDATAVLHDLAQPLSTAGCYVLTAHTLAKRHGGDTARLCETLSAVDQQIQIAGAIIERLRGVLLETEEWPTGDPSETAHARQH